MSTQRLFVALGIPDEVRMAIDDWRAELDIPGRPVPAANLHVTLRFIGDVDDVGTERLMAGLDQIETAGPFSVRIGEIGGFPNMRKATVAWLAVHDEGTLSDLAGEVDDEVDRAGFGREDRPFHPHLTLARIRPPSDLRHVDGAFSARISVKSFALYRSQLGRGGAVYEKIESFEL